MDPGSLAIAATVASSAVQGIGAIQQGNAQSAAAGYNAKVAANNAQIETQNAEWAGAEGEQKAGIEGLKTKATSGGTLARQGASGVRVDSPSFQNVLSSEAQLGKLNTMNIRSNAARQAYGYETAATSDIAQSQLDRMQQKYAKKAGYINAATTVLGGAARAAMFMQPGGGEPASTTGFNSYLAATDNTSGITTGYQYDLNGNPV